MSTWSTEAEPKTVTADLGLAPGALARTRLPDPSLTIPNLVTWARIVGCLFCFVIAAERFDPRWNMAPWWEEQWI